MTLRASDSDLRPPERIFFSMPLEAGAPEIVDEEADVKSTGEVVEEDVGDIAASDVDGERREEEKAEYSSTTPSTSSSSSSPPASVNLDDSDCPSEPADPFTWQTLTWDADTVERGV